MKASVGTELHRQWTCLTDSDMLSGLLPHSFHCDVMIVEWTVVALLIIHIIYISICAWDFQQREKSVFSLLIRDFFITYS